MDMEMDGRYYLWLSCASFLCSVKHYMLWNAPPFKHLRYMAQSADILSTCGHTKQNPNSSVLYSSNADDEWTDGMNRRRILHHTRSDKKVGEGDAWGFVPCTTFTWLQVYVSVSGTTAGLVVSSLRTKNRQSCLQFYFFLPFCGGFFSERGLPRELSAFPTGLPSCGGLASSCSYAPGDGKPPLNQLQGTEGSNYFETSTVTAEIFEQSTRWVRSCSVILQSTNYIKSNNKLILSVYPKPDIAYSPAPKDLHCCPSSKHRVLLQTEV